MNFIEEYIFKNIKRSINDLEVQELEELAGTIFCGGKSENIKITKLGGKDFFVTAEIVHHHVGYSWEFFKLLINSSNYDLQVIKIKEEYYPHIKRINNKKKESVIISNQIKVLGVLIDLLTRLK